MTKPFYSRLNLCYILLSPSCLILCDINVPLHLIVQGFTSLKTKYLDELVIFFVVLNSLKYNISVVFPGPIQIDSSTIDSNVEFVLSQNSCILTSQVSSFCVFVSDTIINNGDNFRMKCFSYSEISAILCVLYFLILHFFISSWNTCQLMFENFFVFDICDVAYNWSISLLPPIVLDNLFDRDQFNGGNWKFGFGKFFTPFLTIFIVCSPLVINFQR